MAGLPADWTVGIPSGHETTAPMWYRRSFVERLREARPFQEIGLHGGLTHFIWTDGRATRDVVRWELAEGVKALEQALVRPLSFSFGREEEAYHMLLPGYGIRMLPRPNSRTCLRTGAHPSGSALARSR